MKMNLGIGGKLSIAYLLFLTPIAYLGYQMVSAREDAIGVTRQELAGVTYIKPIREVQDAIVRGGNLDVLAEQVRTNETAHGAGLGAAAQADALIRTLRAGNRGGALQAADDLISKAADGAGLTLDTDLDSYYVQDVLTHRLPEAIWRVDALATATQDSAHDGVTVDEQVRIGVLSGQLKPYLDGVLSDIAAASQGNADKTVDAAVGRQVKALAETSNAVLKALGDPAQAANARANAMPLLNALSTVGTAVTGELEHLLTARIARLRREEMIAGGIALVLFAAGVVFALTTIQRGVVGSLRRLTTAMRGLADNDLTIEVPGMERTDEVGEMARTLAVFRQNAIDKLRLTDASEKEQAARDRRQAAMDRHTQDFGASVSAVMANLTQSAEAMRQAAREMAETARQTRERSSSAVDGANTSSRDLNAVAVAAEEMAASIKEISQQVSHVTIAVDHAVERAGTTDAKVASMAETAERIGDVVQLITSIASQTNLLALNATIEAARAGDAGKGFAVVAGEVKALAAQTAQATEQIGAQIEAIRGATGDAVEAVRDVGTAISQVKGVAAAIVAAIEEQAAATQEISASVHNVTRATATAAQEMEHVLKIAEAADTASHSVLTGTDEVGQTAGTLRGELDGFLTAMANLEGADPKVHQRVAGRGAVLTAAA